MCADAPLARGREGAFANAPYESRELQYNRQGAKSAKKKRDVGCVRRRRVRGGKGRCVCERTLRVSLAGRRPFGGSGVGVERLADGGGELHDRARFGKESGGTALEQLGDALVVVESADEQDGNLWAGSLEVAEHLGPGALGHVEVEEDEVEVFGVGSDERERLVGVGVRDGDVAE